MSGGGRHGVVSGVISSARMYEGGLSGCDETTTCGGSGVGLGCLPLDAVQSVFKTGSQAVESVVRRGCERGGEVGHLGAERVF